VELIRFVIRNSRVALIISIVAGILSGISSTGLLIVINVALHHTAFPLMKAAYAFGLLAIVAPLMRVASELSLLFLGQNSLLQLRVELSRKVIRVPLRELEQIGANRILAMLTEDLNTITNCTSLLPVICINGAVILSCLGYMASLSFHLLLIVFGFMIVGALSYQLPVGKAMRSFQAARKDHDALISHFQSLLLGMKELKLHRDRRTVFIKNLIMETAARIRKKSLAAFAIYSLASSWGQLLVFIAIGAITLGIAHDLRLNGQVLTGFVLTLIYLVGPLQVIMNILPQIGRANVAVGNMEQLGLALDKSSLESEVKSQELLASGPQSILLAQVSYKYRNERDESFELGPLTVEFVPGEVTFLAGGNGSGKTTLAKLLAGLYVPDSGQIFLDDVLITDSNRDEYRQRFAAVFFDFHLFTELLGINQKKIDELAGRYLKSLHLDGAVSIREGRFSRTELSQGQKKRLALLTAFLEDRPIYLFDEWAADQEPAFKECFYREILAELKGRGKTVIVISHDDRYYSSGDRLIRLEAGSIIFDERLHSTAQSLQPRAQNIGINCT
jgi:putative pyoverdin transport system ATP-binding/permease protein